jgi:ribosome-associated protein
MQATEYHITTEFIELNQLLKLCGLAESGGAGGALVSEGNVHVDGQVELRKRCKIRPGQVVEFGDARIAVLTADADAMAASMAAQAAKAKIKFDKRVSKKNAAKAAAWVVQSKIKAGVKMPVKLGAKKGPKARSQENALAAAKRRGVTTAEAPWTTRQNTRKSVEATVRNVPDGVNKIPAADSMAAKPVAKKPAANVFAQKAEAHRRRKAQP